MGNGKIFIKSLEVFVHIGATVEERANKQRLLIDIELEPQSLFEEMEDNLSRTIDYDQLCSQIAEFASTYIASLIETAAVDIVNFIHSQCAARSVAVTIYKFVLPSTQYVAVCYKKAAS